MSGHSRRRAVGRRLAHDIAESLRSQPGRAALSFFSVMIGIVVLTLLLSMLFGLQRESRILIARFGADAAALRPDAALIGQRGYRGLDLFAGLIRDNLAPAPSAAMIRLAAPITGAGRIGVWAAGASLPALRDWSLAEGRYLDPTDEQRAERLLLLTEPAAREAGVRTGGECMINGHAFRVVGLLAAGSGLPDAQSWKTPASGDAMAVMPLSTAARLQLPFDARDAAVFVRADRTGALDTVIARGNRIFADPALEGWNVAWITPESLISGIRDLQRLITLTAGSVAVLCLVLGGTTLMSLMLADVRQRIPEIGLRRALGAGRRDVALLFVVESCIITGAAAIAGVAAAAVMISALAGRIDLPLSRGVFTFIIPVIVSMLLGCVFSFWPARVAAGYSPAQALRNA